MSIRFKKPPRMPRHPSTMLKKVRADNPWKLGESLAQMLEEVWKEMEQAQAFGTFGGFLNEVSKIPKFREWCKEKGHLSAYHVAHTVFTNYV